MSQYLLALCFLLFFSNNVIQSQTVSNDYKNTINQVFSGVDLNKVPHHLLSDYAMEFVDLSAYNGTNTANNFVHKGIFASGYKTLLMARTQTNVPDLVNPNSFYNKWDKARKPYTIALSGLYYKYSSLRADANPDLITVNNNKLYDKYINGIWQNPYETKNVFMMTAPVFKYDYKNMNVTLPENLWYSNQDIQIQQIAINFNDGNGYQNITFGQTVTVNYATEGTYNWDYKLTLTNGQILHSHSKLIVGNKTAPIANNIQKRLPNEPCTNGTLVNGFDQVEFQGTQQFNGIANSATIQIDYTGGGGCGNITRPLIVAEGFESGLLGTENPLGENHINRFLDEATDFTGNLGAEIANYDIIYVNWDQGRDDLRRNALLLEDIITWVNQEKDANATQNVVIGQSMGGVIARYALAGMEQDPNLNHDTSLYISHDAPHQGANIPIGIQYFARHMADQFVSTPVGDMALPVAEGSVSINDINNVFNSQGTRQLLANNINGSFNLDNNAFNTWQSELQLRGYPQQTRNIAISNGSHCANEQLVGPQEELLYLSGSVEPTILLDAIINYFPLLSFIEGLGYVGLAIVLEDPAYLAGLLPGCTNLNVRFQAKTLPPAGSQANIYKGRIRITKKIDFLIGSFTYNINVTNRERNNPSEVQLPLDSFSGGFFPVPFDLARINQSETNSWLYNLDITGRSADSFNFIPTTTALDVGNGNIPLGDEDYRRVYSAGNPPTGNLAIPFHNFYTAYQNINSLNEAHISFNFDNGNWLATELDNVVGNEDVFDCSAFCSNADIIGEDVLCTTGTYSITDQATTANWTVIDPDNLVSFTTNGADIVLNQLNPDQFGIVTLEVTYANPRCGQATVTKDIEVGILPYHITNASLSGETSVCDSQQYTYYISGFNHPCVDEVEWTVSDNLNIISHTANSVTVTSNIFNDEYAGLITANLPNSSFTIEKGVWVGVPNSDNIHIQKIGAYDLYAGRWSKLMASYQTLLYPANGPLNLTFEWQIPYSALRFYDDSAYVDVKPYNPGQLNVGVRAVCECGNSNWKYELFDVDGPTNTLIELRRAN